MKDLFANDKFLAVMAITIISCWAMAVMGISAKDIIIPAIAGICGFVTGRRSSADPAFPKMDEAVKAGTEKLQAAQVEAVKIEGEKV